MFLFKNTTSFVMNQKIKWLNLRSYILSDNVAKANIPGFSLREIKPFDDFLKSKNYSGDSHIVKVNDEIVVDTEVLEMTQNTLEHESLLNIIHQFHRMIKTVLGKTNN
ncbi:MAG: hypothetical protein ACTSXG_01525 [Alphaproteobacteria bacterium]